VVDALQRRPQLPDSVGRLLWRPLVTVSPATGPGRGLSVDVFPWRIPLKADYRFCFWPAATLPFVLRSELRLPAAAD